MNERVLAEGPGRVALGRVEEDAVLSITDEATVRFVVESAVLAAVIDDVPVQLSLPEGHCRIEANGGWVRLEYALRDAGRGACRVSVAAFVAALGADPS